MRAFVHCIAAACATAFLAAPAAAQDYKARAWAASCAACHGTDGRSEADEFPALAGKPKEALLKSLIEFKTDTGPKKPTVMHQHAKGYSNEQLERIADYFSRQKR
jgi:cytochrome subunit of sulfide dehydrogenase